jgi:hypothetical protein
MVAFEEQPQEQQGLLQEDQVKVLLGLQQEQPQEPLLKRAFVPLQKPHLRYVEHVRADPYLRHFASFF